VGVQGFAACLLALELQVQDAQLLHDGHPGRLGGLLGTPGPQPKEALQAAQAAKFCTVLCRWQTLGEVEGRLIVVGSYSQPLSC
jgi:hypothetical protein